MNKKGLIAIVVVLVLILAAGVVFIFVMPNPYGDSADVPQSSQADGTQPSGNAAETPSDTPVDAPEASGDAAQEPTAQQQEPQAGENVTTPPQSGAEENVPAEETAPPETNPDGSVDTATIPDLPEDIVVPESDEVTYEDYQAMSGEEQMAFYDSFPSVEAFFEWYNAAEQVYRENMIEVDNDTEIDLGEITGNTGN